jgi:hypothetical protein
MRALLLLTLLLPPGCVTVSPPCAGAARPQLRAELIFGRSIKGGDVVSEAAWRRFLDEEVTPRFPDGFTVIDGRGQWRGEGQTKIVKEASKVLVVAIPGEAERRARLAAVAEAYKRRFRQESVATLLTPSCVSF